MRQSLLVVVLLAGCTAAPDPAGAPETRDDVRRGARDQARHGAREGLQVADTRWDLQSSGEGTALVVARASGDTALRLFCPAGARRWLVNAPGFDPIASEERFSFGHASNVATLVADASGDGARGGVTGEGPVPRALLGLLSAPVSARYGAQSSGPHAAPPLALAAAFVDACLDAAPSSADRAPALPDGMPFAIPAPADPPPTHAPLSACRVQEGRSVPANAMRAVGTEPFWGVRVDGRCVTYSNPEDPAGTRVWTTFSGSASDGIWTGALRGMPFVMRTRPAPCSDGMSDARYPVTVSLTVGGEPRNGCATLEQ